MATSATLGGTQLYHAPPYGLAADNQLDFGSADLATTILTGDLRPEEFDQYLAEIRYTRPLTLPIKIKGATAAAAAASCQALNAQLSTANRYTPLPFVFTPNSGVASTFQVIGGALEAPWDVYQDTTGFVNGVLHLSCLPFVSGPVQNLGSAGAPLATNATSPAAVTLAPSPVGDVPGDVTLFVKNRSASAIRSLIAAGVSTNTTWVAGVDQSAWTLDAGGGRSGGVLYGSSSTQDAVVAVAHFTAPSLPSDRRVRLYLRASHYQHDGGGKFRVRIVSGSTQVIGQWLSLPDEVSQNALPRTANLADMGAYSFPVGSIGALGAQSTTVYVECTQTTPLVFSDTFGFFEALFAPDDSTIIIETADTSLTIAAASGVTRVEADTAYDSSGNPAGGVITGNHLRTLGGKYYVYTSQGFMGALDNSLPYAPESVDVWATYTPRYIGLAA